jgi:hypothetical protein
VSLIKQVVANVEQRITGDEMTTTYRTRWAGVRKGADLTPKKKVGGLHGAEGDPTQSDT